VRHLRTYRGEHEVDLIVEAHDRRIVALDIKLSAEVTNSDVKHLLWLREQLDDELSELVVITTGTHAYRRSDGVAVVPACLLGP
jgi:predicted AAA+ superfamily ATPase